MDRLLRRATPGDRGISGPAYDTDRVRYPVDPDLASAQLADPGRFHTRKSRDEMRALLRHGNIIPISKGIASQHVETHFPGWTWKELIAVCNAMSILQPAGTMITCQPDVIEVAFTCPHDFVVAWIDGNFTGPAPTDQRVEPS